MFSVQEIKELITWVANNRIRGIEVERSGFRLKIDGVAQAEPAPPPMLQFQVPQPAAPMLHSPSGAAGSPPASGHAAAPAVVESDDEGLHVISSPIVGTFYRSPGPDQEPFVKLGDRVTKGQTLCIVEAMKLMNEIEADVSGEIVRIFAQNVQPVEYGEKLFAIRPE